MVGLVAAPADYATLSGGHIEEKKKEDGSADPAAVHEPPA
jgi:hypothetical protein